MTPSLAALPSHSSTGGVLAEGVVEQRESATRQIDGAPVRVLAIAADFSRLFRRSGRPCRSEGPLSLVVLQEDVRERHGGVIDQETASQRGIPPQDAATLGVASLDGQVLQDDIQRRTTRAFDLKNSIMPVEDRADVVLACPWPVIVSVLLGKDDPLVIRIPPELASESR